MKTTERERKIKILAQNERLNKKFGNDTLLKQTLLKKQCAVFQVFSVFLHVVYFMYTEKGEKKYIWVL